MQCHLGDFREYAELRRRLNELQKDQAKARTRQRRREIVRVLASLQPGDVIEVDGGSAGWAPAWWSTPPRSMTPGPE